MMAFNLLSDKHQPTIVLNCRKRGETWIVHVPLGFHSDNMWIFVRGCYSSGHFDSKSVCFLAFGALISVEQSRLYNTSRSSTRKHRG